ncbi:hypothetical protein ACHWQZ_G011718 [Mnemiopsis leidyi]
MLERPKLDLSERYFKHAGSSHTVISLAMALLLCVIFTVMSTLVLGGEGYEDDKGRVWDSVVRLSDGRTITCDWDEWGQCSRNRRNSSKTCFRKSKVCDKRRCRKVCVMDPYDSWDSCAKQRACRDKWGLSLKYESKECNCLEEMSFRRAWMMQNPWSRRH